MPLPPHYRSLNTNGQCVIEGQCAMQGQYAGRGRQVGSKLGPVFHLPTVLALILLGWWCSAPGAALGQSCGYYVQTKYERLLGHSAHDMTPPGIWADPASYHGSSASTPVLSTNVFGGGNIHQLVSGGANRRWIATMVGSRFPFEDQPTGRVHHDPDRPEKPCNGPGCRSSQPDPWTISVMPPEAERSTQQAVVPSVLQNVRPPAISWVRRDANLVATPVTYPLLRPPQ